MKVAFVHRDVFGVAADIEVSAESVTEEVALTNFVQHKTADLHLVVYSARYWSGASFVFGWRQVVSSLPSSQTTAESAASLAESAIKDAVQRAAEAEAALEVAHRECVRLSDRVNSRDARIQEQERAVAGEIEMLRKSVETWKREAETEKARREAADRFLSYATQFSFTPNDGDGYVTVSRQGGEGWYTFGSIGTSRYVREPHRTFREAILHARELAGGGE